MVGGVALGVDRTHRPDHCLGAVGEDGHVGGVGSSEGALEGQHCEVIDESSVEETHVVTATLEEAGRRVSERERERRKKIVREKEKTKFKSVKM